MEPLRQRPLARQLPDAHARPLRLHGHRVGRSLPVLAPRVRAARRRATTSASPLAVRRRADRRGCRARARQRAARRSRGWAAKLRDGAADAGARTPRRSRRWRSTRRWARIAARYPDRRLQAAAPARAAGGRRPRARALQHAGTSSSRARHRRSPGGTARSRDVEARLPYVAEMGFDVLYLPPIHPIGRVEPQGAEQHARPPGPTTSAARGRSAPPRAATRRSIPELGTLDDFRRLVAQAARPRHRDRAGHRVPVRARPSVRQRASGVVPLAARRHHPVRREPAEEVPGHLPVRLRERGLAGAVGRAEERVRSLDRRRACSIFRVDNPHTKPFAFWEWVIGEVKRDASRTSIFLAEAFTRPEGDAPAGQARLHAVVHLLHLAQHQARADRVLHRARRRRRRASTSGPNVWPNTPDILHRVPADRRPRRRSWRGWCWRRRWRRTTASTARRSSCSRARAARAGQRGVPATRRSTSCATGTSTRPTACARFIARVNRIRRENPALHADWSLRFHAVDNDQLICLREADSRRGNVDPGRGQPRPAPRAVGLGRARPAACSASTPDRAVPGARPADRRALPVAAARATT